MSGLRRWVTGVAAVAVLVACGTGADGAEVARTDRAHASIDLRAAIGTRVRQLRRGGVPVLFPPRYVARRPEPLAVQLFADDGHEIQIFPLPDCRSDDLNCPIFTISAAAGADPPEHPNVRLHGGLRGRYRPGSCDFGCSGPTVTFVRAGVGYRFDGPLSGNDLRRALLGLVNRALAAGPR